MVELNRQPQQDFGGLSPEQVARLLYTEWDGDDGVVRLCRDLSFDDVVESQILNNARTLLEYASEHGPLGATQAGNLKLDVVAELVQRLAFDDGYLDIVRSDVRRLKEQDVTPLHTARVLCELAGLLEHRSQRFHLTAAGRDMLDPTRAGELFATLFRTWACELDFDSSVQFGEWPELQQQAAYTLYRLPSVARDWRSAEELLPEVVLPFALQRMPATAQVGFDMAAFQLALRMLEPLTQFALLERRPLRSDRTSTRRPEYRATPLASAVIAFQLDAGAVSTPRT